MRVFGHNEERITEFPEDFYTTDAFSDHAVKSIQRMSRREEPFFLHVCYTAPHYPLQAPKEDIEKYVGQYRSGWEQLRKERHARQIRMGLVDPGWKLPPAEPEAGDREDQADKD